MEPDNARFRKRMYELSDRAQQEMRYIFSDFLTAGEQRWLSEMGEFSPGLILFGGYPDAERQMVRFGDPELLGYEAEFPIVFLKISPAQPKFAEKLEHRDFLGSVMGLGLERAVLGDLVLSEEGAVVPVEAHIAPVIREELTEVRHTRVKVTELTEMPPDYLPRYRELFLPVSSVRLDAVVAQAFHLSRANAQELVRQGRVQVGGIEEDRADYEPDAGDVLTVRGFGKLQVGEITGSSKKGRSYLSVRLYL